MSKAEVVLDQLLPVIESAEMTPTEIMELARRLARTVCGPERHELGCEANGWFGHEHGYACRDNLWRYETTHGCVEAVRTDGDFGRLFGWRASYSLGGEETVRTLENELRGDRPDGLFTEREAAKAAVDEALRKAGCFLIDLDTDEGYDPSYELEQDDD